jgi:hypothetical protein
MTLPLSQSIAVKVFAAGLRRVDTKIVGAHPRMDIGARDKKS